MSERLNNVLYTLLLIAIALLIGFLSTRYSVVHDFSHAQRSSLGDESKRLLETLDGPVEIVSYARAQGALRKSITDFVERYRQVKHDIELTFVDPDGDPTAMRAAGVQIDGELDVRLGGRSERLRVLSENELSSALLRLSRAHERLVVFLEGEGERRADGQANADLGQFGAQLSKRGARVLHLALGATPRVPDNVELVVIANPRVTMSKEISGALLTYVERGGNLLWFLEPGEAIGLDALADAMSLRILPGVIVDGASQALGIGDPSMVAASRYPEHAITRGFDLTTLFPQPLALAQVTPPRWDFKSILRSSAQSWNESGHIPKAGEPEGNVRYDGVDGEIPGPLDFGFALTRAAPRPGGHEQRVVVMGDGDFLSNSFLGNGGNREFGGRIFDWLLTDDALIDVPERAAPDRTLTLSQGMLTTLSFTFLIALPLMFAASGLLIWRRRKRRQ